MRTLPGRSLTISNFLLAWSLFVSCAVPTKPVLVEKHTPRKNPSPEPDVKGQGGSIDFENGGAGGAGTTPSCATAQFDPVPVPLDLYVMMDRSASMDDVVSGTNTKWKLVGGALDAFMGSSDSAGIGIGVGFFPVLADSECAGTKSCKSTPDCGPCGICLIDFCSVTSAPDSCIVADYELPTVPIGTLPAAQSGVSTAIEGTARIGQTPLSAAFDGAHTYAASWAAAHPERSVVIVLATDGYPTSCGSLGTIESHAKAALDEHSLKTFVIGVGSEVDLLDSIAKAGGTKEAYLVEPGASTGTEFAKALGKIRDYALGCTFELPSESKGAVDFEKVNVSVNPSDGESYFLPKVAAASECRGENGWYYDSEETPTRVFLCPTTCEEEGQERSLEIVLGCATVIK